MSTRSHGWMLVLALAGAASGQGARDWILSEFTTTGDFGGLAYVVPSTGMTSPIAVGRPAGSFNAVTMHPDNRSFLVAYVNTGSVGQLAHVTTQGVVTSMAAIPNSLNALAAGDGGFNGSCLVTTSAGLVCSVNVTTGATTTLRSVPSLVNGLTFDQDSGDVILAIFGNLPTGGSLLRMNRAGTLTTFATGLGRLTGVDYDPTSGSCVVTRFDAPGVLRVQGNGIVATVSSFSTVPNAVKVVAETGEMLVGGGFAAPGPNEIGLLSPSGAVIRSHTVPKSCSGVTTYGALDLTGIGRPLGGNPYVLRLSYPGAAGATYVMALSTGMRPGIRLPNGEIVNLDPTSPLFALTLGGRPGLAEGFVGVLDGNGEAQATIHLPGDMVLAGQRFFAGSVRVHKSQVQAGGVHGFSIQLGR